MILASKFALIVTTLALMTSGALVIPVTAQGPSSSSEGSDPTSLLQSAKMHLIEAMKDIKSGNSPDALTQINMTNQGITLAEGKLNASLICNNVNNEGFCEAPPG